MDRKENFYIFLDIDGVLWDWKWRMNQIKEGKIENRAFAVEFNPESIQALNFFISELEKNYNCKLVISSTWRNDMQMTESVLQANGLKYSGELNATPISENPKNRGNEILAFLGSSKTENFVIIDDESFDFKQKFSKDKIIKTSLQDKSLTKKEVEEWLLQANLSSAPQK